MSKINRKSRVSPKAESQSSIVFIIIIIGFFFHSCKVEAPIPEEKFVKIYVDMLFIQDTTSNTSSRDSLKQIIFQNHEVTEEMYLATVEFYSKNPEKWEEFFDKATTHVEEIKAKQVE